MPDTALPLPPVLVVDLDGTLILSDMLYESLWSALASDWRTPFRLLAALPRGRGAVAARLADAARIDPATLPYNPAVLSRLRTWREQGGRTALITGADPRWAEAVAGHLGLFDEVHGPAPGQTLTGAARAALLAAQFGRGGFAYAGDARADLPVWEAAGAALTVGLPQGLRGRIAAAGRPVEHLPAAPGAGGRALVRALRPHQWLKNLLVFVPMLAAHELDPRTISESVLAFAAFCLMASAIYIINDLVDLQADRAHPRKRARPFASGAVPIPAGMALSLLLATLATVLSLQLGSKFFGAILFYLAATSAYSFAFKRQLVIDICLLAGLYTVRIIGGGFATGISLTVWLLGFSVFIFFALAAVKRQAELVDGRMRGLRGASGRGYHIEDLPLVSMMAVSAGYVAVLVLALYINLPQVAQFYSYPKALWGICPILLYWVSRMVMVTHRGEMHDDPLVFAAKDPISLLCLGLTGLCLVAASVITV